MNLFAFPPHVRLMLLAARVDAEPEALLAACSGPVDWQEFLAVTKAHRLSPLVFRSLQAVPVEAIPADVLTTLERRTRSNQFLTERMLLAYQKIAAAFHSEGQSFILLKGAALSTVVYGDATARHGGDLDLLTSAPDLLRQIALLGTLGYRVTDPPARLTPGRMSAYQRYWKGVTLEHTQTGITVDLHWRLFHHPLHPANSIVELNPAVELDLYAGRVSALPLEAQLLYSATHGAWDGWVYFKGLADVAAALHAMTDDQLDCALTQAAELNLLQQVSSAVHLAREWFGATAEHPLLCDPADAFHQSMRRRVLGELQAHHYRPQRRALNTAAALRAELHLVPGIRSSVQIMARYLWRPRVWLLVDLPDSLVLLYPVLGALLPPRVRQPKAKPAARPDRA